MGAPGWLNQLSIRLPLGHDLTVPEFEALFGAWSLLRILCVRLFLSQKYTNIKTKWKISPMSAQVMISWLVGFKPRFGLYADNSEPAVC